MRMNGGQQHGEGEDEVGDVYGVRFVGLEGVNVWWEGIFVFSNFIVFFLSLSDTPVFFFSIELDYFNFI
jgi:hypothetical protein